MGPAELAAVLAPLLIPFVKRAGTEAREQLAARMGGEAVGAVSRLWGRLQGHLSGGEEELAEDSLEPRLVEALAASPELLEEARAAVIIVEGDRNTVQHGNTNINISGGRDINIGRL